MRFNRYDVDGYFGITQKAPTSATEVMKYGKSVCQGYANVMELLCSEAEIPVKVLSGYAKGYGYTGDEKITTENDTDHAWNAIQLGGKWYLVDCTWAAGHLGRSKKFVKRFQPFYFLTESGKFITDHYPFMNKNMEESMKWQLLEKPISLEVYNKALKMYPDAYILNLNPVSHKTTVVDMQIEEIFTFRNDGMFEIDIMASLKHLDRNTLTEQPLNVFVKKFGKTFRVRVHPNQTGTFHLTIFGKNRLKTGDYDQVCEYVLKVGKIDKRDFEFPQQYSIEDECELVKPMQYKLKANSEIEFYLFSPYFLRVMVGDMFLEKAGASFKGTFKTGRKGEDLTLYGSREAEDSLEGLFTFIIV